MGCLALLANFLLPGLGTLLFTTKKGQGFTQLAIGVLNWILIVASFGLWAFIGAFVHLGLFVWALATTISFMSEQSAKKAIQEHMNRQDEG
jgi:hypothetical protein